MGKDVRTEQEGRALVEAWEASGLSQTAFAKSHGISQHIVSYWKRRLARPMPAALPAHMVRVSTTAGIQQDGIHIHFPSGIRVDVNYPMELGDLLSLVARL